MHSIVNIRIKDLSPPSATLVVLVMYLPLSGDVDSIGVVSFMFSFWSSSTATPTQDHQHWLELVVPVAFMA